MPSFTATETTRINILKGIAIIAVFIYHAQLCLFPSFEVKTYNAHALLNAVGTKSLLLNFSPTAYGWAGVQLFLLISGFLIHYHFLAAGQTISWPKFFQKRFWRIYPPYMLILLLLCLFNGQFQYYFFTKAGLKDVAAHLALVHNLSERTYFSINASFWSLALEAQLYILYPVLLFIRKKVGIGKTVAIITTLSFVLLLVGGAFHFFGAPNVYPANVFINWFVWAAGAFLAEKYIKREKIFNRFVPAIIIGSLMAAIVCRYYLYTAILIFFFLPLALLAFFEWFLYRDGKHINGVGRIVAWIGLCSYSIYLIHQPMLAGLLPMLTPPAIQHTAWALMVPIVVFVMILLFSYILYRWVERKSIALGKRLSSKEEV